MRIGYLALLVCFVPVGGRVLAEEPLKVSVCELQHDPAAYNHRLVELTAFVSWGFEDFTLFDPTCYTYPDIWLEYGGKTASGTIYCCGPSNSRTRPKELEVDGVPVTLIEDDLFKQFDERVHARSQDSTLTRASLVGRFFAGRKETYPSGKTAWVGFGHMGCCQLLAIQQVKAANFEKRSTLDSYGLPHPMFEGFEPTAYYFLIPNDITKYDLECQRQADSGERSWAFTDPKRVALELIQADLHRHADPSLLRQKSSRISAREYVFKAPAENKIYTVAVSRPYWLSFYATDPNRVAWVALYATAERMKEPKQRMK